MLPPPSNPGPSPPSPLPPINPPPSPALVGTTGAAPPTESSSDSGGLATGAIVGIAIGVLAALAALAALVFWPGRGLLVRNRQGMQAESEDGKLWPQPGGPSLDGPKLSSEGLAYEPPLPDPHAGNPTLKSVALAIPPGPLAPSATAAAPPGHPSMPPGTPSVGSAAAPASSAEAAAALTRSSCRARQGPVGWTPSSVEVLQAARARLPQAGSPHPGEQQASLCIFLFYFLRAMAKQCAACCLWLRSLFWL